jgi:3-phenylpropionate/trans-cinnamate dioxygenase ferredoxin subunit
MVTWVKIFNSQEEAVARIKEGVPQLCILLGKRICLVRQQHTFYAVQDACTHNGESLSKGTVNHLGEIICPWHNYCFNLQSGRELHNRSAHLRVYPVKSDASGLYVGIF